ncbi:MAG TPA: glycosyltransferase [Candidatus Limnocylindria bacterium]|nr:glycosyltransferase [Candidatus Limnocylindria bacterium]
MSVPLKIAVVFYNIGPYHHARLNAAAERGRTVALEWSARESYPWGRSEIPARYEKRTLLPDNINTSPSRAMLRNSMNDVLSDVRPNVLAINGWNDFGALETLWCALRINIPVVVMSESSEQDTQRSRWKEWVKRRIVARYSAALVGGRLHADYLQQLGMSAERIFTGYDVVDNAHFASGKENAENPKIRNSEISGPESAISAFQDFRISASDSPSPPRPGRGIGGEVSISAISDSQPFSFSAFSPFFLASARFIEKKNLFTLLRAYADYRTAAAESAIRNPQSAIWNLVLLGDGPLRPALNSQLSTLNLHPWVQMPGFKQYDELPAFYARAGAFVHASTTEQWGLVVNEAIAAGLPVLVSNRCGCVLELVREGVNGFAFDPENQNELTQLMAKMASLSEGDRQRLARASRETASQHEPARFGEGLRRAAELAVCLPRKRAGIFDSILLSSLVRR